MTTLSKAVDKAVAEENKAFLADEAAQKEAHELGKLYARVYEAHKKGFAQKQYPEETLEAFCQRAGV